jgi:hypothetical protein
MSGQINNCVGLVCVVALGCIKLPKVCVSTGGSAQGFVYFSSPSPSVSCIVYNPSACARPGSIIINTNNGLGTYHEALTTTLYRRRQREDVCARGAEIVGDFIARVSQPAPECGGDKFYWSARRRETSSLRFEGF